MAMTSPSRVVRSKRPQKTEKISKPFGALYERDEIEGALRSVSHDAYLFRLVHPALTERDKSRMMQWGYKLSMQAGVPWGSFEDYADAQGGIGSVFFSMLKNGAEDGLLASQLQRRVIFHFGRKTEGPRFFFRHGQNFRFADYVVKVASGHYARARARLLAKGLSLDRLHPGDQSIQQQLSYLDFENRRLLNKFLQLPTIAERATLVPTRYRRIVQEWAELGIDNPISALIQETKKNPKLLREFGDRTFERVVAQIFADSGWHVDLTGQTRDKGRDVICLSSDEAGPRKVAIEVKCYAEENKIGVKLINQFLGAHRRYDADRLLFITTSSYTRDALEQAEENSDILTIREFSDVIAWAKESEPQRKGVVKRLDFNFRNDM